MKKISLILIAITLALTINAQWYATQYGVTNMNELTEPQLDLALKQGQNLQKAGIITTVATTIMTIAGAVIYSRGINDIVYSSTYSQIDAGVTKSTSGAILMYGGALGMCVGIPMWIVGGQRVNTVKVHLTKFDQLGYNQYGVGINVTF